MVRSSIRARLAGAGAAAFLIGGLFAQAAPSLAASPSHVLPAGWTAGSAPLGAGSRGTHNVRAELAQAKAKPAFDRTASDAALAALEARPRAGVETTTPQSGPSPAVVGPPAPDPVTDSGNAAPTTPVSVAGQDEPTSGTVEPASPGIAVAPDELLQVNNHLLQYADRNGGVVGGLDLTRFFDLPEISNGDAYDTFDSEAEIHFDSSRQRWIATELSWDCATGTFTGDPATFGHGYIDYAISNTTDFLGAWSFSYFFWNDLVPDRPEFGTSTANFGLSSNLYAMSAGGSTTTPGCIGGGFQEGNLILSDWAQLGPGFDGSKVIGRSFGLTGVPDLRFAIQEPETSPEIRIVFADSSAPGLHAAYDDFVGSAVKNNFSGVGFDLTDDAILPGFATPPAPHQPSSGTLGGVNGDPDSVIFHNGVLAFTSTYPCTPTGDSSTRDCVRVVTLGNAIASQQPTRIGDTLIGTNGFDDSFGGIGWSGNGELHVIYTRSSASSDASSYDSYHAAPDAWSAWSAPHLLSSGSSVYAGSEWGGDPTVATDSQDPASVWVSDAFAAAAGKWATKIHQITVGGGGTKYNPITPVRVLDSRSPSGAPVGLSGPFVSSTPRTFAVANTHGIPADAVAITGNLTVTGQTGAGYVSLGPVSTANPSSSTLNVPLGDTRANNVTIALAADGSLSAVYKSNGGKHASLILDVTGYFRASSGDKYQPVAPSRILDSRSDPTIHSFVSDIPQSFQVRGDALTDPTILTIPADATAITANLTVTGQTRAGYVSLTPDPTATPGTSTINFPLKDVRANGLTVPIAADGTVAAVFKGGGGKVDLVIDVTGYYTNTGAGALLFYPLNPGRRVDTRLALGSDDLGNGLHGLQSTTPRSTTVAGHFAVPNTAIAITGNLTVTGQTAAGRVALTDVSNAAPTTSTINFPLGDTRANGVTVPLGSGTGELWFVYQASPGKGTQLILDITGYFQ
ncbi:MAG TPA: hypothetical protein VIB99_06595 [Candidatus Limnocylindrales bacterium]